MFPNTSYSRKFKISLYDVLKGFILNIENNKLKKIKENYNYFAFLKNDKISNHIFLADGYEKKELDVIFGLLEKKLKTFKRDTCLDVGASFGYHSIYFSKYFKKIIAFEPNPDTFTLLKFNTKNFKNINIVNKGLLNRKCRLKLFTTSFNIGGSSIEKNFFKNKKFHKAEFIKFDNFGFREKISMIKIDTEGSELKVLKGLDKTITKYKPVILFEQLSNSISRGKSHIIDFLEKKNYVFFYFQQRSNNYVLRAIKKLISVIFDEELKLALSQKKIKNTDHKIIVALNKDDYRKLI